MRSFTLIVALVAIAAASCASDQAAFRPAENVTDSAPGGQAAASYEIRVDQDDNPDVHVNVWSMGADQDGDRTFAQFGIEVRNLGTDAVTLDPRELRLDAYTDAGTQLPQGRLVQAAGPGRTMIVPPGEASTFRFVFELPGGIEPDKVGSMRVRWGLDQEDGQRYVQFTGFSRIEDYYYYGGYDPVFGFYDPFFYGAPYYGYGSGYTMPVGRVVIRDHHHHQPQIQTQTRTRTPPSG